MKPKTDMLATSVSSDSLARISAIIPAYKRDDLLERCLLSLLKACGGRLPETIVVDDAQQSSTERLIATRFANLGIRLVQTPQNRGFAGAVNFAYPFCTCEFVVLVNSDIVLEEEPFSSLVEFLDDHPDAAIAQGKVVLRNGHPAQDGKIDSCGFFLTPLGVLKNPTWLKGPEDPCCARPRKVFFAYGAFFVFRNGLHNFVGGELFHDFFHMYHEEADLCHRAWLAGREVWYVPTPPVFHAHGATAAKSLSPGTIMSHGLANAFFSYETCFGFLGRFFVLPLFRLVCLELAAVSAIKGDRAFLHAWRQARSIGRTRKREVRKWRSIVHGFRQVGDCRLFKTIMLPCSAKNLIQAIRGVPLD